MKMGLRAVWVGAALMVGLPAWAEVAPTAPLDAARVARAAPHGAASAATLAGPGALRRTAISEPPVAALLGLACAGLALKTRRR